MRCLEVLLCRITVLFPKVLVVALYSYALYVETVDIVFLKDGILWSVGGAISLILYAYGLYTYFQVVRVGCGSPLDFPELCTGLDEDSSFQNEPPQFISERSIQVKSAGTLRYCKKCHCWKPDRSHHCSSCNRFQLKMDHHCPWFAQCVGYRNYKFFIQFLICTVLYSLVNLVISGIDIYDFFKSEKYKEVTILLNVILLGVLALTMFFAVGVFMGFTLYFLFHNMTTIEHYDMVRYRNNLNLINDAYYSLSQQPNSDTMGNAFDLGWKQNWREVMGANWLEWIKPSENQYKRMDYYDNRGLYFDVDNEVLKKLQRNTALQQQLLDQLRQVQSRQ